MHDAAVVARLVTSRSILLIEDEYVSLGVVEQDLAGRCEAHDPCPYDDVSQISSPGRENTISGTRHAGDTSSRNLTAFAMSSGLIISSALT